VSSRGPLGSRLRREFTGAPSEPQIAARHRRQAGYTLIELIVASAIGLLVMVALTSVVLTSVLATDTATSRVEASAQIRNFQLTAYDDFALSQPPNPVGCGTKASPCTTQDMLLQGDRMPIAPGSPPPPYAVRYAWDPNQHLITRFVGASSRVAASNVKSYSWYLDRTGAHPVVVVSMTVTAASFYSTSYAESQTLLFYPRVTSS
jgi:prepilin-type N-terminal cleavage/methylation domain-containing protein